MDLSKFTPEKLQEIAALNGVTVEELLANNGGAGKQNGSAETTPPVSSNQTPAGDSSSGDISLESQGYDLSSDLNVLASQGIFGLTETPGRENLEAYFKPIEGVSFEETGFGTDYLIATYTDPVTGEKKQSNRLSFDETDEAVIAENIKELNAFITGNVSSESLAALGENITSLTGTREEEKSKFVTPEDVEAINAKYSSEDLFTPYTEVKTSDGMAYSGVTPTSRVVTIEPFKNEIENAKKGLLEYAEANDITISPEELQSKAENIVRQTFVENDIIDLKLARAKEATKSKQAGVADGEYKVIPGVGSMYFPGSTESQQGNQFIADAFIQHEKAAAYNSAVEKSMVIENERGIALSAADAMGRMFSGESLSDEEAIQLTSDLSELGIFVDTSDRTMVQLSNGVQILQSLYNAGTEVSDMYNVLNLLDNSLQEQKLNASNELQDADIALDASRRDYSLAAKSANTVVGGFAGLGLDIATLANEAGTFSNNGTVKQINRVLIDQAGRYLDNEKERYQRDVSFEDAFNDAGNFGEFMLQEIMTQIPIMTTMIASGGSASWVAGATSMGNKFREMTGEELAGEAEYSMLEKTLKSTGYGLAEGVFSEITTTRIIKNAKAKWVQAGKSDVVDNSMRAFAKDNLYELGLEPFAEMGGEILTTGAQNLIDGRPITEGMDHSGFSGYSMGLIMQAVPFMRGVYVSRHSDYKAKENLRMKQAEAKRIQAEIAKESNPEKIEALRGQLNTVNNEINAEVERVENLINKHLTARHAAEVQEATKKQTELQLQAIEISKDDTKTNKQKAEEIQKLREQFNDLQYKKEQSLSEGNIMKFRSEFSLLSVNDNPRYKNLLDLARQSILSQKGDDHIPTEKEIEAAAYDIYLREELVKNNNQAGEVQGAKVTQFDTTEEMIRAVEAGVIIPLEIQAVDGDGNTTMVPNPLVAEVIEEIKNGSDGFNMGDEVYISIENQVANQRKHIGTHEVGHYVFDKIFKGKEKQFGVIASSLLKEAKRVMTRAEYKAWAQTIEVDKDGNYKAHEVISRFLELVADNKVGFRDKTKKRGLAAFFGANLEFVAKDQYDFDFKGEDDIVNFVVGLGNKIASGKLTLQEMSDAAANKITAPANTPEARAAAAKTALRAPKFSQGSMSNEASRAKETLEKMSSDMRYFDPNSPIIARVLNGMIKAQLAKYAAKIPNFQMDEAISDVVLRIYEGNVIGKFNTPEYVAKHGENSSLYGYLNSYINFRIRDMFKDAAAGKVSIAEDFGGSNVDDYKGAAPEATTSEDIQERATAEKPQYPTLLEKKIVSPETLETIKAKIPRIVGTIKNRIDEAVSKNRTVKPYVNELRLALGKQIDIDLKQEMGGKKDHQLRKWLTKNKKALLENMTTTYLMQAMPIAVQKKVDGVWTSDWQGKKIDRETTSTDMAGRTSGAEMVRRLPQASLKIDDKTFLSYILEESGNPIRGKKESWAKAIAEELAIELVNESLQDPDSEIYRAMMANQERVGAEIAENAVAVIALDLERGNIKWSKKSPGLSRTEIRDPFIRDTFKNVLNVFLKKSSNFGRTFEETMQKRDEIINSVSSGEKMPLSKTMFDKIFNTIKYLYDRGLFDYMQQLTVKSFLAKSEIDGLGKDFANDYTSLNTLEKLAKSGDQDAIAELQNYKNEVGSVAANINTAEIAAFGGGAVFGDAEISMQAESTGDKTRATRLTEKQLKEVHLYSQGRGLAGVLKEIQQGSGTAQKALDSGLISKIQEANLANKALAKSIATDLIIAVKSGELSTKNLIRLLQRMNEKHLYKGFRATGQLAYFSNGISGSSYIEHVYPNIALMLDIVSLAADPNFTLDEFGGLDGGTNAALDKILRKNTLLATDAKSAAFFDTQRKENKSGILRFELLDDATKSKVYSTTIASRTIEEFVNGSAPLETLQEHLNKKAEVEAYTQKIGINWSKAHAAKNIIKPSIKFSSTNPRAIFMVGGPGAGKSSIVKGLGLIEKGYRLINQDPYLEKYIEEAGLPTDEKTYDKEQRSLRAKLGWKARKAAEEDLARNTAAKESMIVDGTGASYNATTKKMKALEDAGFEIHMIHVNTSRDIAVKRNRARAERSLADFIVTKTWDSVQESAAKYREDYKGRFYEINTDNLGYDEMLPSDFVNQVNSGLEQSSIKFSKGLSQELNEMIERTKGVSATKVYSRVQAQMQGEKKGKYRLFVPASAEDFRGLTAYTFAGKGRQGEADQKWVEEKLIDPYTRGVAQIDAVKQQIRREYHAVAKANKKYFKMLGKKISNTNFTYDQALRVYMWTQQGIEIPGMDIDDVRFLINEINQFPGLIELGNAMQAISRQDTWVEPGPHWMSNTIVSDLNSMTEKVGRKKYLAEFIENADAIFSPENLNKIEAVYGTRHREALEDSLYSMINGRNRPTGMNRQMNQWLNWVNNSTGAIMFFNIRSAVLQNLSATNFINWSDNNPIKAAAAFANQPQFWKDFAYIFNSDKLKQRRSGLQTDVNEAEIANMADGAQNKASAVIAYLLKIGFTPTQIADSFAIAMGGSTFYRNRVNTYLKQGMKQSAAETKAWEDFSKTADEAQQSSDPYLVSQEQRSPLGRLVLAFQNTPMQYTRLMKKSMQDIANGRGDFKTHLSKIIYYGAVQNFVFSALQSALFAVAFEDDEDESGMTAKELEKKEYKENVRLLKIVNSMTDSILKGSGVKGAVLATIKNTITEYFKQEEKGFMADHAYTLGAALSLSPPIGSKYRKIYAAIQTKKFEEDVLKARGFDVAKDGRINLSPAYSIIGSLVSGAANVPMDRMVDIINSYSEALDSRNEAWQRIALALGWKTWDVGVTNEEHDLIKTNAKEQRKEEGKKKAAETRARKKAEKEKEALEDMYKRFPESRPKGDGKK
jgi:chloramphenicol 3-O-phosphotransferase